MHTNKPNMKNATHAHKCTLFDAALKIIIEFKIQNLIVIFNVTLCIWKYKNKNVYSIYLIENINVGAVLN